VSADVTRLRVVITRPLAQAQKWRESLQAAGIDAITIPLLELRGVTGNEHIRAIKNVVLDFDHYQKAIFVSQNAVDFALQWLEDYWPQLPLGIDYFAVGETTARQLQQRGLRVSALTAAEHGAMNSESLLAAAELQQVAGDRIVIFRGCGGRGHMGDILQARGASVTYCELYERLLPEASSTQFVDAFAHADAWQQHTIVALHSGESLENYRKVLQALAQSNITAGLAKRLQALPLLVPGERVAQLAGGAGFNQVFVAENATDASMLAALQNIV
jgi:uroporphyrinogen-III synthase